MEPSSSKKNSSWISCIKLQKEQEDLSSFTRILDGKTTKHNIHMIQLNTD